MDFHFPRVEKGHGAIGDGENICEIHVADKIINQGLFVQDLGDVHYNPGPRTQAR